MGKTNVDEPCESVRLELDRRSKTPYHRQIYERLFRRDRPRSLAPWGEASARSLASHLATSRGTIDLAYSLLSDGGYLAVSRGILCFELQAGGMHLLARCPGCRSDRDWAARAMARGLAPHPLSTWRVERDCGQGLLLSFTNIAPQNAREAAVRLKQAIDSR